MMSETSSSPPLKTVIKLEVGASPPSPSNSPTKPDPVYHQRKCMISEYKELFSALLRLPDKEMQAKVLNCINAKYRSVGTQTIPVEVTEIIAITPKTEIDDVKRTECASTMNGGEEVNSSPQDTCSESAEQNKTESPKKRKRKRKISLPQANKVSRVAVARRLQQAKMSKPFMATQKRQQQKQDDDAVNDDHISKRSRINSISDFSDTNSFINGIFDDIQREETRSREQLFQVFLKDCILAEIPEENGLLPIQESVIRSKMDSLNRQVFIWKNWKKVDLNEILSDEGEDLLQLGIIHKCYPETAKLLLDKGLDPCSLDEQGNTVLHLAVLHDVDKQLLQNLMERIDLKMLLTLNDEGYTSLHLAVRRDCYLLAECILDMLDERLSGKRFHKRYDDIYEADDKKRKKAFHEYYEKVCLNMETDDSAAPVELISNHDQKQQLLQAVDMRSGNTALFFAMENQSEHLVYFLLAHLIDPRTENFCGQDCKSYFSEYCKTLNLSLNIDCTMEKVIKLLS